MNRLRLLIVDDHPSTLVGLEAAFCKCSVVAGITVRTNLDEADWQAIAKQHYDVIVCDYKLPGTNGLRVLGRAQVLFPHIYTILISGYAEVEMVRMALASSADGFLLKDAPIDQFEEALLQVTAGQKYVDPSLDRAIKQFLPLLEKIKLLSEREKQVIKLSLSGQKNSAIAKELFVSRSTVENHKDRIKDKLEIKTNQELLLFCFEHRNLIFPESKLAD